MKFLCHCGHTIRDQADDLPYKAYAHPDQSQDAVICAFERLMQGPLPTDAVERDALIRPVVEPKGRRTLYQCPECGRIYVDGGDTLHAFIPEFENTPKDLFKVLKGPDDAT